MNRPVLIVLHQEHSSPGRVGLLLKHLGYPLDIRKPRFGDVLPATLEHHAGAVIFGGPMSANDPDDFIRQETDWLAVPLDERAPFLGICLGAQMLARHLGASVGPHPEGRVEVGYYPIRPTPEGARLLRWPPYVYQWHREAFALPRGSCLLAQGCDDFPYQAFSYGPAAFALQFHPELTLAMMNRWTVRGRERFALPGAQPRAEHFLGRAVYDRDVRTWLEAFLALWLAADSRGVALAAE
jgi:GMP synthase (glutamine-hydrolysing)